MMNFNDNRPRDVSSNLIWCRSFKLGVSLSALSVNVTLSYTMLYRVKHLHISVVEMSKKKKSHQDQYFPVTELGAR